VLSAINYVGVRPGSAVQTALTMAKLGAIVLLLALLFGAGVLHAPAAGGELQIGGFFRGLVAGLFAFGGWHMVTYAAEETRNPERTIPRALMVGHCRCCGHLSRPQRGLSPRIALQPCSDVTHIAYDATLTAAGPAAASAISILVIVSSLGANSGIILAGPRVYYAMAEDGLLFRWMGAVHPTYRTPYIAIVAQAIWSSVLVLTGTYGTLVSRVVYTEWIFFGALALGTLALRRGAGYAPAFRAAGFPAAPVLFAIVCLVMAINQIVSDPFNGCGDSASCSWACRCISSGDVFMRVIDFHNHYYPPKYMQALQSGQSSVKVTIDKDGNPNLHYPATTTSRSAAIAIWRTDRRCSTHTASRARSSRSRRRARMSSRRRPR
jgi:APA family basic amino acid/polyamine antiporter